VSVAGGGELTLTHDPSYGDSGTGREEEREERRRHHGPEPAG